MKAYKLFKFKNDKLYSLFIHNKNAIVMNEWLKSECYPTNGFAVRSGWHCCFEPHAPHLKMKLASGEIRVWAEVEVDDYAVYDRPKLQGGKWILANYIKINKIL